MCSCSLQRSAQRVCSIFVLSEPGRQSIKVGPNIGLRFLDREKGAGTAHKVLRMRLGYDIQALSSYCGLTFLSKSPGYGLIPC
jgi:hypothetical protein